MVTGVTVVTFNNGNQSFIWTGAKISVRNGIQGVKPTLRGVMNITGGRVDNLAEYLINFNKKRNAEVLKLSDEIGSSVIGKLIAGE